MMRVTNSMIVKRTKSNINNNRAKVDRTNNQMSTQKKITKPSDNPIIAIRSLRLRSALSTATQYYENNIPDTESWMKCTETALVNMKDLLSDAYNQTVYGATDELSIENRRAILKDLQSLQQQVYCEGNANYDGRTIFTGYKTNQNLTFINSAEAKEGHYWIEERFTYEDVAKKNYYAGRFDDTSANTLTTTTAPVFDEVPLHRIRMAYDEISEKGNGITVSYKDNAGELNTVTMLQDGTTMTSQGCGFTIETDPKTLAVSLTAEAPEGYFAVYNGAAQNSVQSPANGTTYNFQLYSKTDWEIDKNGIPVPRRPLTAATAEAPKNVSATYNPAGQINIPSKNGGTVPLKYSVKDTSALRNSGYVLNDDDIVFDYENGELLFGDKIADIFDERQVSIDFTYDKNGFKDGELRPEFYFNCKKYTGVNDEICTEYVNYDGKGEWMDQAIYYNIAAGQQMQINTEAKDVFSSDIRRDMDDLIEVMSMAIKAEESVNDIKAKINSGDFTGADLEQLNKWLDAAKKQYDYANQNMHDTYSAYITKFQGYMDVVNLAVTDLGGRGERVELTKNRMSVQQSTFKELKSINEDMDLSELVINYTAASVSYQAALQAAAKIGKMTLLDFI